MKIGDTFWLTVLGQVQNGFILVAAITFLCLPRTGRKDYLGHSEHHTARGMFWINAAVLIYFSGTFFLHLVINYLLQFLHNDLIVIWMINNSLGLVFYGLITYGLIKVRREYLSHIISI